MSAFSLASAPFQSHTFAGQDIETLPDDLKVAHKIDARNCRGLRALPEGLAVDVLDLEECVSLTHLPDPLSVAFLNVSGCTALRGLPNGLTMRGGRLVLRDCAQLMRLPEIQGRVAHLDLAGCLNIRAVPESLEITSSIDIGLSGIAQGGRAAFPKRLEHLGVHWRGVPIDLRIAFEPETLSSAEILGERNAEVRRVMLERYGFEKFMDAVDAEELDRDTDPGGERRLLRVAMDGDEDLVCVSVFCPSTDRQFFLRVPPSMQTCHQAIAWTAGFDDPDKYKPALET